jgi:peptidoglycan/xylan/chitin deacetylase (PgdA/CDA1 family)
VPIRGPLRNRSNRAVFLCYHSVAAEGPKYLTVGAELFELQLRKLRERGFRAGGRAELEAVAAGAAGPPTVFLTFDDGFDDNHSTVLPLLREYGFAAFCFVLPPLVDTGGPLDWPEMTADLARYPATMRSVTWDKVGEMAEGGFEIGAHTLTHPHLPRLRGEELRSELCDSRTRVIERLGRCDTIAYPFGEYDDEVARAARECGYSFAFTLPTGVGQRDATPWTIPRLNVDYRDSGRSFDLKLSAAGRAAILSPVLNRLRGGR